jgi:hypothetical protein
MDVKSHITKELQDLGRGLDRYLEGLTEQEVSWAPAPGASSITENLFHTARFEDEFVQQRILSRPEMIWEQAGTPVAGNPVTDSSAIPSHRDVLAYYLRVRSGTLQCLHDLSDNDLAKAAMIPQGEVTVADVLSIVVCHFAQHLGAITYLRRLQRGPAGVEHV